MKITGIRLAKIHVPLRVPFKTALRRVDSIEDVIVEIDTDTGEKGFGENINFIYQGRNEWQGTKDDVMGSTNEKLSKCL